MADYGLKLRDADAVLTLDTIDQLCRFRYSVEVSSGGSGNVVLSDISGFETLHFAVCLETRKAAHLVTRSGTTISWVSQAALGLVSGDSLVLVFLIT